MRVTTCSFAIALLGASLILAPYAKADSLNVLVGYADNLRPSGFFPTPWLGDPNVVSESPSAQTFDSGAIRIDNTGATPINITNFQVFFPNASLTFTLWAPLLIAPGQMGIFAQNNFVDTQFDTSDFGVFGGLPPMNLEPNNAAGNGNTNLIGGCSSPASFMTPAQVTQCNNAIPVISFSENGNPLSFSDTGHILDTGGWDFVNNGSFGEDGNESINWNTIGGSSRGGGGVPEPSTMLPVAGGLIAFLILGSFRPTCQIFFLLRRQAINRHSHRLEF